MLSMKMALCAWYLVPGTRYQVSVTWYLVPRGTPKWPYYFGVP